MAALIRRPLLWALILPLAPLPSLATSRPHAEQFIVSGAACDLTTPSADGTHTLYWEAFGLTEVCVKPALDTVAGIGAELYFVLVFEGRGTESVPMSILVRAHSSATMGEASFRHPRFWLSAGHAQLDLVPTTGRSYQFVYPCDQSQGGCAYNGIISRITRDELRALARASTISGHVLGADFELRQAGIDAVRALLRACRCEQVH